MVLMCPLDELDGGLDADRRRLDAAPVSAIRAGPDVRLAATMGAGLQLDDEAADLFLHGNADRVFGLAGELPAEDRRPLWMTCL
jgi:hypothetical protein